MARRAAGVQPPHGLRGGEKQVQIVAYAQKLAEGDGRSRLYLRVWAKDLKAEGFCKKCRFRKSETVPMEVLPGVTLDITTWEKLWR